MNTTKLADLGKLFTNKGFNPVIGDIYKQQEKYLNWYRGDVNDFHYYKIKTTGGAAVTMHKPSLQMMKKVCEDKASLMYNERSGIVVDKEDAQKVLNNILDRNNFADELLTFLEFTAMNGTGVLIEYVSNGETKINMSYGNTMMVLSYENTTITELAIVQEFQKDKEYYTHITYHLYSDGFYKIEHEMYKSKKQGQLGNQTSLSVLFSDEEIASMRHTEVIDEEEITKYYVEYETTVPHFQVYKYAIANNFDVASPMGISVGANALSLFETIDEKLHSFNEDNINSRKKVFLNDASTKETRNKVVVDGKVKVNSITYVDRDNTLFQSMKLSDEKPIEIYAPDYDAESHINGIKLDLALIGFRVGLGHNYYNFDNGQVYVNEKNLATSSSEMLRNKQKDIIRLINVLERLAYSVLYLEKELGNYKGDLDIKYEVLIDDSMIEDDESRLIKLKEMTDSGYAPKYLYTMKVLRINEEEAKKLIAEQQAEDNAAFGIALDSIEDE